MTDEELFNTWKSEQYKDQSTEEKMEFVEHLHTFPKYFEKTFLAGLKAVRPQWHDLQKDPTDLPKFRRNILVTCEYRSKLKKKRETFEWDYNSEMPLHAIAWCELPTFDKE